MFIIEHFEKRLWKWCLIEYEHLSSFVGKDNLWFTNVKRGSKGLAKYGKVIPQSIKELNLKKCCILDPAASKTLTPREAKKFQYFIFGGILGDYPPKQRTKKLLTPFVKGEARNIDQKQMSTDNAVAVVKLIRDGYSLNQLKFQQGVEIPTAEHESVVLPYRYVLIDKQPFISPVLVKYLKRKKGF